MLLNQKSIPNSNENDTTQSNENYKAHSFLLPHYQSNLLLALMANHPFVEL